MRSTQSVTENGLNDAAASWTCAAAGSTVGSGAGAGGALTVGAMAIALAPTTATPAVNSDLAETFTTLS